MAVRRERVRSGWTGVGGILLLTLAAMLLLSLLSYVPADVRALQTPPNPRVENLIGPVGAWTAFGVFMALGLAAYVLPPALFALAVWILARREGRVAPRAGWGLLALVALCLVIELSSGGHGALAERLNLPSAGGLLGLVFGRQLLADLLLGEIGTLILAWGLLLAGGFLALDTHPAHLWRRVAPAGRWLRMRAAAAVEARRDRRRAFDQQAREVARERRRLERALGRNGDAAPVPAGPPRVAEPPEPEPEPPPPTRKRPRPPRRAEAPAEDAPPAPAAAFKPPGEDEARAWTLPPMTLLAATTPNGTGVLQSDLADTARILTETLSEFGIDAQVTNVETGPVVTRYEVLPAPGVRVERIAALSNNIALTMKAESVRVQAPIPGKGVVGIEVPNSESSVVTLREVVGSAGWNAEKNALPLALGKDVGGRVIVADLAEMPHLLIAGATGSGKTVCMNSLLTGLLMSRTPDQLRLLLVDPKIVEFSAYNDLPHLVVPVITDPKKVALGLRWAIAEMEKRYKLFAKVGVRNIRSFNTRPVAKQADLFGEEPAPSPSAVPERLPYIVVVVDELADLMLVAQADIENAIARLAQLSRAVGIHMILATQRPSVNVITGTIKANFPGRIAFQVAQRVDSRTILDANGADKLLGRGDMLFLPPGSGKLVRAQGCLTLDPEVHGVCEHWRAQGAPQFEATIREKIEKKTADVPEMDEDDGLIEAAIEIIRQTQRASTSSLQRRLRIGYTRAARIMDLLEEKGIVGPAQGSDPRDILIDLDGDIPSNPDLAGDGPDEALSEDPDPRA